MNHYIRPDWVDNDNPYAPWNLQEAICAEHCCDWCGDIIPDLTKSTDIGYVMQPERVCDTCLVPHAKECGDWDEMSMAALKRVFACR